MARSRPDGGRGRSAGRFIAGLVLLGSSGVITAPARAQAPPERDDGELAVGAGRAFLRDWVDADGRVVRRDHGDDTVSEGQGYALTIAVAIGDGDRFRTIWNWTRDHLQRDDGLFAWRWADGSVTDSGAAADADLYIAAALTLAAARFDDDGYAAAAAEVSGAILAHETVEVGGRDVLVAGDWAVSERVVNPSYLATPLMGRLEAGGAPGWGAIADTSRDLLAAVTTDPPHLPPDWATIPADAQGVTATTRGALDGGTEYGWDAARTPVQLAADCTSRGRAVAAAMWPFFLSRNVEIARVYAPDGTEIDGATSAVAIVGAAGAARAAGEMESARALLARAQALDEQYPTYYGAAWVALGRMYLTTNLLGSCPVFRLPSRSPTAPRPV